VHRQTIELLRCPRTRAPYELDPIRVAGDEVVEAFLVSTADRTVRPVFAGVAVLPLDLRAHLRSQGDVYRRSSLRDPRMVRFVIGQAGSGHDRVPFDDVIRHYRDLAMDPPPDFDTEPAPEDVALSRLVAGIAPEGPALVVGCGVARQTYVVRTSTGPVVGVDRSLARVRRARNIAVTVEHFHLPGPRELGVREVRLDLDCLVRDGCDFLVADPHALPFADGSFGTVLVEPADGVAPFGDEVVAEAQRVLAPGGRLLWRRDAAYAAPDAEVVGEDGPYVAGRG
jgi:SAM-dependent methyltransferase